MTESTSPAAIPGRPVARDISDRLQSLTLRMADEMLRDGYSADDVSALASLVTATAEHNKVGLAVREFVSREAAK
ncbi:hypothetical protein [Streptomyces sp. NPDC057636]|uniref:hypothetical protein n=1 Tax=Streptomyces sp. NPDC057636 TaxID=3346189 RepID=UPI0036780ED0